jgi:uncharacterized protein (TIGR02594 family)
MIDKDSLPLDKPRRTPDHPTKSHVVKTMVDGSEKIIRFGEQGAVTAGKPKEGESDAMKAKRASFKARHGANIAKGKSSPAYWADKVKWAKGGSVSLEDLDQKYEGIKKPDFENLRALNSLIQTLQQSAEESRRSEFDPVAATRRSAPSTRSLADLFTSYEDAPMASHAGRVEAGVKPADALSLAASQMGLSETGQRAAIQDYLTTGGANLDPATTAWCAAFVNSTLQQTGGQGTGSNMARSFLDWGQPVDQPQEGDVAVFSRGDPSGPYGHVGFFKGYDDQGNVLVLGGNQGDAVSISPYPRENLLGFRRAGEAEPQKFAEGGSTGTKSKPAPKPKPTVAAAPNRAEAYRKSAGDRELDRLLQENLSKPLPASAYVDMPWSEYLPRVGRRLPSSTAEMLDDTANMVLHPIDTASAAIEGVGNLGYGIGSKALRALGYEGDRASEAPVDATLAALMGRYGLGERGEFWKNLAEDPASYVADVAGLVTGGAAAAPKVARLAEAARGIAPVMYADAIGTARALASGDLEFMRGRGLPEDAIGVGADIVRKPGERFIIKGSDYFDPPMGDAGRARDPAMFSPFSSTKHGTAPSEFFVAGTDLGGLERPTIVSPSEIQKLYDRLYFATGDRTSNRRSIEEINDIILSDPTITYGGPEYIDQLRAWASEPNAMAAKANAFQEVPEGIRAMLAYMPMGQQSGDFSDHMAQTFGNVTKRQMAGNMAPALREISKIDRLIAEKFPELKNVPSVASEGFGAWLSSLKGGKKAELVKAFDKADFKGLGMPDVSAVRFAITNPDLVHSDALSIGYRMSEPDASKGIIRSTEHPTYGAYLPMAEGTKNMSLGYELPWYIGARDTALPKIKPGGPTYALPKDIKSYMGNPQLYQKPDQQWVDEASTYGDLLANKGRRAASDYGLGLLEKYWKSR